MTITALYLLSCLALAGALAWTLLWRPRGDSGSDQALSLLLELQEQGVSHSGAVTRRAYAKALLDCACRLTGCPAGAVLLWDEVAERLRVASSRGSGALAEDETLGRGEGSPGQAYGGGRMVQTGSGTEAALAVPLLAQSKPTGVLSLHGPGASPSAATLRGLSLLAGEAAVTLHNLELFERLEAFYLEMVKTLARAVDSKDAYTHEHSDRASLKAKRLAEELRLSRDETRYIEYAALLHDIGKIGIDEAILLKPGKLTPEEYEVMKKHPIIGHQILAPVKYLGPVAEMVLYHQEWYNGQGYPKGLKGEEIPLGARIVAVIDAWDAMTSDRPYRKALGREIAISELRKGAGTQFDPKVVEAFLKLEAAEWSKAGDRA